MDSGRIGVDDLWSTADGESYSSFTTSSTTPDGESWQEVPGEHVNTYGFQDPPLFDDVCCPMDTIMEKNPLNPGVDDYLMTSLFPMTE